MNGEDVNKQGSAPIILLILTFLLGLGIMLYPTIANIWNTHLRQERIANYSRELEEMADSGELDCRYEYEKAFRYNDALWPTPNPEGFAFLDEKAPSPEYLDCLNVKGDGMMGYVSIPKIDVEIPIYHGTDEETLLNAAGHLEGTSLPIGGKSTHSVIVAHRGLPGSALFTNLDKLETGDHFFLHVLDEKLCYEVDQITIVEPKDVSNIVIEDGKDLCTLLTCTPYGVNTHRLLVRGHRVDMKEEDALDEKAGFSFTLENIMTIIGIAIALSGIAALIKNLRKGDESYEHENKHKRHKKDP